MLKGTLVGVSVLRMIWSEFWIRSRIWEPLWSVYGEYHTSECALKSPVVIRLFSECRYVRHSVISWSSVDLLVSLLRGEMYMLAM